VSNANDVVKGGVVGGAAYTAEIAGSGALSARDKAG